MSLTKGLNGVFSVMDVLGYCSGALILYKHLGNPILTAIAFFACVTVLHVTSEKLHKLVWGKSSAISSAAASPAPDHLSKKTDQIS